MTLYIQQDVFMKAAPFRNYNACMRRYFDMSRSCISCMSLSGFDYGTLIKNCFIKQTRSNLPGLLVLSKRRLIGPSLTYFDPEKTILNRAYISFEVHIFRLSTDTTLFINDLKQIHSLSLCILLHDL